MVGPRAVSGGSSLTGLDGSALSAFIILVLLGGANAVAVRFSNLELPPFWGAALRFCFTAIIFWVLVLVRKSCLPRGTGLIGTVLYGFLSVGASYAFLYWGLLRVQAGLTMVVLAFVPLLTQLLAWLHGLEPLRWRGLVGAVIALAGILFGIREGLGTTIPVLSLLALVAGAACIAEASVVFKLFPQSDPVVTNALAVTTGALMLIGVSLIAGEAWLLPSAPRTWLAFIYLVVIGSVLLFYLYLFVLARWTATASSYSFLLFPVATVFLAAWIAGERGTASFVVGGVVVLVGVWFAALSGASKAVKRPASASPD